MNPCSIIRRSTLSTAALVLLLAPACVPMDELSQYKDGNAGTSAAGSGAPGDDVVSERNGGSSGASTDARLNPALAGTGNAGGEVEAQDAGLTGSGTDAAAASSAPCSAPGEVPGSTGESCYLFAAQAVSWLAAEVACSLWGGHLATLGSPDEDAIFTQHMSADTWLGLNDVAAEGRFVWADGSALGYTRWAAQEPNNSNNGDCAEKRLSDGFWYDQPCATAKAYACERPLAPAAPSL